MSEFPSHGEGHVNIVVGKMDGVVRKAGNVVAGATGNSTDADSVDDEPPPVAMKGKQPDKHSMDYMLRSGIAGGLAGCAVCITT